MLHADRRFSAAGESESRRELGDRPRWPRIRRQAKVREKHRPPIERTLK